MCPSSRLSGPARLEAFKPQADLGQLGCQGVDVDAVETVGDDVVHGLVGFFDGRFGPFGAHCCEAGRDAPAGGDQEVPGAAGGVAYRHRQEGCLGIGLAFRPVEERVEGAVEEASR